MTAPEHGRGETIEALVARSSFGDSAARRARAATPAHAAKTIYQRSTSGTALHNATTTRPRPSSSRKTGTLKKRS